MIHELVLLHICILAGGLVAAWVILALDPADLPLVREDESDEEEAY